MEPGLIQDPYATCLEATPKYTGCLQSPLQIKSQLYKLDFFLVNLELPREAPERSGIILSPTNLCSRVLLLKILALVSLNSPIKLLELGLTFD